MKIIKSAAVFVYGVLFLFSLLFAKIEKIGHRGCLYEPENTASAFKKAIELGVDTIKFDLWPCKTGELIVINEERVDRLADCKGFVRNFTLDHIKQLDVLKKEKFLTFQEALDCINKRVRVFVEFKEAGIEKKVALIINEYIKNKGWSKDLFIIASFHHRSLLAFSQLCPGVKLVASLVGIPVDLASFAERMHAYGIGTVCKYVTSEFVEDAHKRGIKIYTYAVDSELETLDRCINLGVDAIMADYPDKLDIALKTHGLNT